METIKRNYKSDFDFIFDLGYYDERGEFVKTGWPPYYFELRFYTGRGAALSSKFSGDRRWWDVRQLLYEKDIRTYLPH